MRKIFILISLLATFFSCQEENNLHPFGKDVVSGKPGKVTDVTIAALPGGAVISYKLPPDQDIQYVKALYQIAGKTAESRSSKFSNTITIEGFGDTNPHEVQLYCVDQMENVGDFVSVTITPLTPPIVTIYENLVMGPTFGGLYVDFLNGTKTNIGIHILAQDSLNQMYEPYVHYTTSEAGRFYVRDLEPEEAEYGFYVTDRWGNKSDTTFKLLTPFAETRLDKSKFRAYILPNDEPCNAWGGRLEYAWNDDFTPPLFVHSPGGATYPVWFTFDLGVTAKLSRYKFYHLFMQQYAYQRGNLKRWEVWGIKNTPPADGSWDGWIKLMDCESYKPSGLPVGQISAEDWEYLQNGEDFIFPPDVPEVRYIRFKILETWGGIDFFHFTEFTFWGTEVY